MTATAENNVSSASALLLEEIEAEIEVANEAGAKAFAGREYDKEA
ncbi:MAG: hypothetical protein RBU25_00865 [Lentisphaeria bacterium]|jgi:hypothetical protein|nr:hypothetical protein [Lentisphaeria bacterium]